MSDPNSYLFSFLISLCLFTPYSKIWRKYTCKNHWILFLSFFSVLFIFTLFYFTILCWFCHPSTWVCHGCTCVPNLNPPPSSLPYRPSGSSQCPSPEHPVSCIEPGLVIHFLYDIIHVSMQFSQIIPPSPSPYESRSLLYTSVSFWNTTLRQIMSP